MQKIFAKNVLLLILMNLIIKPFWIFGIDRNIQLQLGNDVYGNYFSFFNLTLIFQIILDMGLHTYNNNMVAQQPAAFRRTFPNIFVAKLMLTVIYYLCLLGIGLAFDYNASTIILLLSIGSIQVANSYMLFIRGNVAALQLFKHDRILSILDRLIVILILGSILFLPYLNTYLSLQSFVYTQIVAMLITAVIGYIICIRHRAIQWKKLHLSRILSVIEKGFPYAILVFCMAIYMRIDAFMIATFSSTTQAGIYAKAFRLVDIANNMSGVLIASILLPLFAQLIGKKQSLTPITQAAEMILLPFSIIVASTSFFYSELITETIYGTDAVNETAPIIALSLFLLPLYSLNYIYSTLLTAGAHIKAMIRIAAIGSIITVVTNYIALQYFSQNGLAAVVIANIIAQSIVTILFFIKANQLYHTAAASMLCKPKMIVFLVLIILSGIATVQLIHNPYISFIVFIISTLCITFVTKTIAIREILNLIKSK